MVCASCGEENPGRARFCLRCGAPIATQPAAREVRKTVTVLFCDVTGSTELGERLDPEALRGVLARYFDRMRAIVEGHGGTVEKFIGDAVMAVFGVPVVHEDDALRAARAAVEMRDALPELGIAGRLGVTTGEVVTGTEERLATGDPVNVAARLQQAAGPGDVLIAAATLALIRDAVRVEAVGPVDLKGKSTPVEAYRLLSVSGEEGITRRPETPLVGRARERRLLADAWERATSERSCHLFTILGPAGVGKSRLAAEFLQAAPGARVARGRCLPYGEGITYWPVVEVVKQLPDVDPGERAAAVLRSLLAEGDPLPSSTDEIAWAFRRLVESAAGETPLAVVFDDLHWGEETFLELVEHVADLSRVAPILLLCVARPELLDRRSGWSGGKVNATTLLLEPLSDEETDELISELVTRSGLEGELHARIRIAAEGNPFFVEQMVALVEASPSGEVAVPPTIQALLAARLDQLEPAERNVLQSGAVEGRTFHGGGVHALVPEEPAVEARLISLVRKEFVRPDRPQLDGEDAFRFRHLLIRDAAYDALPKASRAELHARFAAWLAAQGAGLAELDEIVGYHLEQACRYRLELGLAVDEDLARRAVDHLAAAGRRALLRSDSPAACSLLERALALVSSDKIEIALERDFIVAIFFGGRPAEAVARAAAVAERAAASGDRIAELCARIEEEVWREKLEPRGASARMSAVLAEAEPVFESAGGDFALHVMLMARASLAFLYGRFDESKAAVEQAIVHARLCGLPHLEPWVSSFLGANMYFGSTPAREVLAFVEERLAEGSRDPGYRRFRIHLLGMLGHAEEARPLLAELCAELREQGQTMELALTTAHAGAEFELNAGDVEAAVAYGREGCALLEQVGERGWLSTAAGWHAEALYRAGRLDEAGEWAERALDLGASDDAATVILAGAAQAKLLARRGDHDEAVRRIREVLEVAQGTDMVDSQGNAYLSLAEVLEPAGDLDGARKALEHALACFERKENLVAAERTRARLERYAV